MDVKCNHCLRCGPANPCGHQLRFCAIKEEGYGNSSVRQDVTSQSSVMLEWETQLLHSYSTSPWQTAGAEKEEDLFSGMQGLKDFEKGLGIAADGHMQVGRMPIPRLVSLGREEEAPMKKAHI
ncbi:hypothetical protein MUK42_37099 [Musa troglodytarum]|uniref:Uncharacterized protein n=1 Tax=Musa troglodytarum TaxID=320322 RepID=A0A9E7GRW8_9LILI|nr:hypothetical protein MUK42_37099 [Musa troglodytarum]